MKKRKEETLPNKEQSTLQSAEQTATADKEAMTFTDGLLITTATPRLPYYFLA